MKKICAILCTLVLIVVFASQAMSVSAKTNNAGQKPLTSPITSADCKPGFGYGDKNHCHSGPPGQQ